MLAIAIIVVKLGELFSEKTKTFFMIVIWRTIYSILWYIASKSWKNFFLLPCDIHESHERWGSHCFETQTLNSLSFDILILWQNLDCCMYVLCMQGSAGRVINPVRIISIIMSREQSPLLSLSLISMCNVYEHQGWPQSYAANELQHICILQ